MICGYTSGHETGELVCPDHERSQIILVLFGLFVEIGEVETTICQALHGHNLQSGHDRGLYEMSTGSGTESHQTHCRVRSVRTEGYQANVTMTLPTRLVVRIDDAEASVFARSSRVRLERARVETSNSAEI